MMLAPDRTPEYFFFGMSPQTLFGCYHPPTVDREPSSGVILCYPYGHEYFRVYRAYRQLAIKLSSAGFHVLRFDFYGCGDSSADFGQAQLCHWMDNIALAAENLKQRVKLKSLFFGGLRLGGTLALMAAENRKDVDGFILWEPVVSGTKYLDELVWQQSRYIASMHREYKGLYADNSSLREVLGFELTSSMTDDLKKVDLLSTFKLQKADILLLLNGSDQEYKGMIDSLKYMQGHTTLEIVEEQKFWLERPHKALVPMRSIQAIITWLKSRIK